MGVFQILKPLRRRWWILLLIVIPITLGTLLVNVLTPKQWEGTFTMQESGPHQQNEVNIYPTAQGGGMDIETRMNNLQSMFTTQTVLQSTWDDLARTSGNSAESRRYWSELLEKGLVTEWVRGTDFLKIGIITTNEDEAKQSILVLYDKFRSYYNEINRGFAQRQREFIQEQVNEKQRTYDDSFKRYSTLIAGKNASALDSQTQQKVVQIASLESVINDAERTRDEAVKRVQAAQAQMKNPAYARNIEQVQGMQMNPVLTQAITEKANLENFLAEIKITKGVNHPDRKSTEERLQAVNQRINDLTENSRDIQVSSSSGINSLWQQLKSELTGAEVLKSVSEARVARATEQLNNLKATLSSVPAVEEEVRKAFLDQQIAENDLRLIKEKLNEAVLRENEAKNAAILRDIDRPHTQEVDKKAGLKTLLALAISLVLAISVVLVISQFDTATYSAEDAEKALGYPVISALPKAKVTKLAKNREEAGMLDAAYQVLSANIVSDVSKMQGSGIIITGSEANVGRTTVAANLAISLARDGYKVLLVDADFRQPTLHRHFGVENRAGFTEVLQGDAKIEEVALPSEMKDLVILPAGKTPLNPIKLLRSPVLQQFLDQAERGSDYIVFDTPSGVTFADAGLLAQVAKNVIIVHEAGSSASAGIHELIQRLKRLNANIIGIVLNKVRCEDSPGYVNYKRSYESTLALKTSESGYSSTRSLTSGNEPKDNE